MATSFKTTSIKSGRVLSERITPDESYWKDLQNPVTVKEYGAITNIDFCPKEPHHFAVSNSMRVQLYDGNKCSLSGTVGRFKDTAYSGSYRNDGTLLVAGTEDKYIKLFNTASRSLLRTFMGHKGPVHVTKFLEDGFRLISGSNDKTARVWDIPTQKDITVYKEHKDYIRAGLASKASHDIFLTGSYDHTVKLWDARTQESVLTVNHGFPVESVLMFPNGGIFMSSGGNFVKLWDALGGGKLLATLSNHHKTVTSLCFCSNHQRFMSASLDQLVKVYDVSSYQVVHTFKYPGPILSHAVSPDDKVLAVGMSDKMLSIRRRKEEEEEGTGRPIRMKLRKREYRRPRHEHSYQPSKTDQVVELKKREILAPYDRHLKSFKHSKALDEALKVRVKTPEVTVSVIQELIRRGHIQQALAGRNESGICVILTFILKNLNNPLFTATLTDVLNLMMDLYGMSDLFNSGPVEGMLNKLKGLVDHEAKLMTSAQGVLGSLNLLFAVAENALLPPPPALAQNAATGSHGNSNGLPINPMNEEVSMDGVESSEEEENGGGTNGAGGNLSLLQAIGSLATAAEA